MALPTSSNGSNPSSSMVPAEWPKQAADTVVDTIAKVRDKTTKPAIVASRALVYGLIIGVVGAIAVVVLLVGLIRFLDNYLPGQIWTIYLGFAVLFSLAGVLLLRKANKPVAKSA